MQSAKENFIHKTSAYCRRKMLSAVIGRTVAETEELLAKPPAQLSELEFWVMPILAGEKKKIRRLLATLSNREEEMRMAQALLQTMSHD